MKKERYFRHELERMFIAYAIVPAVVFTLSLIHISEPTRPY
mgnify:CR=1 FL=1